MHQEFKPSFFMKNRHIQTLYASFFRKQISPQYSIENFYLKDGDFVQCNWYITNNKTDAPLVILFHGLTGSAYSHYIKAINHALSKAGYNTVLMHFRGCGEEMNNLPRSYHSGETSDALEFINYAKDKYLYSKIYAIGYSLGANMLLKLLGESSHPSLIDGAIAISTPFQLDTCANVVQKGFARIYQKNLMHGLREALVKKYVKHDMESLIHLKKEDVRNLKSFWDFDSVYTAPVHGFESAQEYYTQCSSRQYLKNIQIKTLLIQAKDDPFMNESVLPTDEEMSSHTDMLLLKYGGHVGFINGSILKPEYWLESYIVDYLNNINPL